MAYYAFLDENNIVTEVIPGVDESEQIEGKAPEVWYGEFRGQRCVRTSFSGGVRKNFAGVGYTFDEDLDAFIAPKPFESWVLDEETARWEPPVPHPTDSNAPLAWNETTQSWEEVIADA